ncbi:MAG: AAA family ATPase [Roseiarcus sp.]
MSDSILKALQIEDFKCFELLRVPFALLTVLSGYNGAGKSTALQPLLLLAQAARRRTWTYDTPTGDLPLNGEIVRLGSAGDVIRAQSATATARFEIFGHERSLRLSATAKTGARSLSATKHEGNSNWPELFKSFARLVYLSAVRGGPAEAFPTPDRVSDQVPDVGAEGQFASYWYHERADTEIDVGRRFPEVPGTTFRKQVDAWLSQLAPGASANVQALPVASMLALQFRLSETGEWRRPANVGYGLTYSFPILVALLSAEPGDIVVIDSPEAHLHPQAQSRMGRMLAAFAAAGIQLVIETHSDHVLNGIRLAVRDKVLGEAELSLLFFAGSSLAGHGVTSPRIDGEGRINEWPDGFFDQGDKDVAQLAGWN